MKHLFTVLFLLDLFAGFISQAQAQQESIRPKNASTFGHSSSGVKLSGATANRPLNAPAHIVVTTPAKAARLAVAATTETFNYSGAIVTFPVPAGVTSLTIEARGAEGSNNNSSAFRPGKGAIIMGTIAVTPSQQLKVLVGQQVSATSGNGGGGGSFVTKADNTALVIAGGGGGSGNVDSDQKNGQIGTSGGNGANGGGNGGTNGEGGKSSAIGAYVTAAGGGLLTNGEDDPFVAGTGGKAFVNGGSGGSSGGFGGGGGGSGGISGGGGGGYSGGGNAGGNGGVGGGGGSYNAGTNQTNMPGANSGNGVVIISYTPCTAFTATLTPIGQLTCSQKTVTLTAGGGLDGATYQYSAGATNNGATATVMNDGPYSVTVTNPGGCSSTATTNVTSNTTAPNVTLSNNGPIADNNQTVTLTATGGTTYAFSSGATSTGNGSTATVTTPGIYSVTATRSDNGCTATASTTVTGAQNPATICRNGTAVIRVTATGNPVKYEWYKNTLNSARLADITNLQRGTATSSLTLINQQVTANYYVRVTDANGSAVVYGPFKVTVNMGCIVPVGGRLAAEEVELKVTLLGNPLIGEQLRATVQGASGKALNVQLLDLSGKMVRGQQWQQAESDQRVDWNLGGQSSGVYLLQAIVPADGSTPAQRHSLKVIKP